MQLRRTILDASIWLTLGLLGCTVALRGAVAVLTLWLVPSLPFATDPCADGMVIGASILSLPLALVCTALIATLSFIADRHVCAKRHSASHADTSCSLSRRCLLQLAQGSVVIGQWFAHHGA